MALGRSHRTPQASRRGARPVLGARNPAGRLPPGQREIAGFPRFGVHLATPSPDVPDDPVIEIRGALTDALDVPLARLATLPRREYVADFHCVAGWTARNLRWEGVPFADFYGNVIAPALAQDTTVTHLVFGGRDGYRCVVTMEDALAGDVLIAEHLDGSPLSVDHGAPARVISPRQYGFVSTKHLSRIEVHATEPADPESSALARLLFKSHRRARVWEEERHGFLPARVIRPVYRAVTGPLLRRCARGDRDGARPTQPPTADS